MRKRARCDGHFRKFFASEQGEDRASNVVGSQIVVRNKKCPTLRNVIRGVQLLLTIANGQWNIHAGQSECGHFGNRTRTRATHDQISNGKRIFHC